MKKLPEGNNKEGIRMTQIEKLQKLNNYLLSEMPQYRQQAAELDNDEASQFRLFRSLVNVRMPKEASREFLDLQDDFLHMAIREKEVIYPKMLRPVSDDLFLWQGDITTLAADAIVNAANSGMLGCFCPCHGCIDNAIHTYAGVQLRLSCAELMKNQGYEEPTGQAKITPAFNLPSNNVIHTVGPIVSGCLTDKDCELLASCYYSCLTLADKYSCESIAFCCISTGEFHFPNDRAAEIAINTVRKYKIDNSSKIKVIFNVFKKFDYDIYRDLLGKYSKAEK